MSTNTKTDDLAKLVERLRSSGARNFKGTLKDAEGKAVWDLDLTFDTTPARQMIEGDD